MIITAAKADAILVNWTRTRMRTVPPQSRRKGMLLRDSVDSYATPLYGYWDWKVLREPLIRCVIRYCIVKTNY